MEESYLNTEGVWVRTVNPQVNGMQSVTATRWRTGGCEYLQSELNATLRADAGREGVLDLLHLRYQVGGFD